MDKVTVPRTAEAIAAHELRSAILRGDLAPGEKIRQEATAAELGISLIPLREALKTLASEGAVTYVPQRGFFVTELPDAAMQQIYGLRGLVEAEAERAAVPHLTAEDLTAMRSELRDQERAVEDRDAVEMIATNRRLHYVIFDRSANPWLIRFVTQLWDALDPYRVLSYRHMWDTGEGDGIAEEVLREHAEIIAALEGGKQKLALKLLDAHRGQSQSFIQTLVRPIDDSGDAVA